MVGLVFFVLGFAECSSPLVAFGFVIFATRGLRPCAIFAMIITVTVMTLDRCEIVQLSGRHQAGVWVADTGQVFASAA